MLGFAIGAQGKHRGVFKQPDFIGGFGSALCIKLLHFLQGTGVVLDSQIAHNGVS